MTDQDYIELQEFCKKCFNFQENVSLYDFSKVAFLSPSTQQEGFLGCHFVNSKSLYFSDWNLLEPHANKYDLIFASNVFMYINEPKKAIQNVLNCCKGFIMQDLTIRKRNLNTEGNELGTDGDCMRYYFNQTKANYENAYDLSYLGDKIKYFKEYKDNEVNTHFITFIKGNL